MDWIIPELRQHAVELDKLKLDPANANTHPEKNLRAIMDSLSAFGQRQVVLARKGTGVVIAGNGRLMAARALGWSHIAAVYVDDDDITAVRYAIADNRTSELSEWDQDVLGMLLQTINDDFGSLEGTGFAAGDLDALLAEVGGAANELLGDPDDVPEPPVVPVTQPGDVWLLGNHRVMCGDSTKAEDVERLMDGARADLIWTDPPYGVNHIGGTKDPRRQTHRSGGIVHNDDKSGQDLVTMVSSAIGAIARHDSTVLYVASPSGANVREMIDAFNDSGFEFRHSLVWVKNAFVFGRADYHYRHELILYGWAQRHEWIGPRDISTVFEFPRGDKAVDHPTSKPVGLVVETSKNHPVEFMADPFLGSGTTLIAAEQLGRKCYGMEISSQYCDVIVKRWQSLTGKSATLEATGETFEETRNGRTANNPNP